MKLHIQTDKNGQGNCLFIFHEADGIGPHSCSGHNFGIETIDASARQQIRELLDVAEQGNWEEKCMDVPELARAISSCFERILLTMPKAFDEEPVFVCPEPLATALSISTNPIALKDWLEKFPSKSKEAH